MTTFDTWYTGDLSVPRVNFSGGNLTAVGHAGTTPAYGNSTPASFQVNEGKSSGKWYWEVTINADFVTNVAALGVIPCVGLSGGNLGMGFNTSPSGFGYFPQNGAIFVDGAEKDVSAVTYGTNGDVISFALDCDNKRIWVRKNNGNWMGTSGPNGVANPATNTQGFDLSASLNVGRVFAAGQFVMTDSSVTANFGASGFAQSVPSGFGGWTLTGQNTFGSLYTDELAITGQLPTAGINTEVGMWTAPGLAGQVTTVVGVCVNPPGGTQRSQMVIYDDTGGQFGSHGPGNLLGQSNINTAITVGENIYTFSTPVAFTAGQKLWVGVLVDSAATTGAYATYPTNGDPAGVIMTGHATMTIGSPSSTFGPGTSNTLHRVPILINYSVAGATGSITQTLSGVSQAATAAESTSGTIAQTLGGITQSAAVPLMATAAQTLGGITQSAQALEGEGASIVQTLGGLTQAAAATLKAPGRISEANISAVVKVPANARVSEANVSAVVKVTAQARLQEANISAVVYANPAGTQRADLWKITRRDGVVFGFTSWDSDFLWGGTVFHTCGSLQDSASESSSQIGETGSVTLTGLIDTDLITDAELYGGLFDDAFVEAWVVSWGAGPDVASPFRVAAGWMGKVTRGQASYEAEVLGPGTRLAQTAMVKFFQPGCRWAFGDADCQVDADALTIGGIAATGSVGRYAVEFAPRSVPSETAIWSNGVLAWTSGKNAGVSCQTEVIDWTSGILSLWDLAPFEAAPGDTFTLTPGCTYDTGGCKVYGNYLNYGGFDHVPGPDSLQQNADALFSG